MTKHGKFVVEQGVTDICVLRWEGVAVEWTNLHSEEQHDLYWEVNGGEWWTEKTVGQMGQEEFAGEIKNTQKFQFEKWKDEAISEVRAK
jgi:thymidylate synthase